MVATLEQKWTTQEVTRLASLLGLTTKSKSLSIEKLVDFFLNPNGEALKKNTSLSLTGQRKEKKTFSKTKTY